MLYTFAKKKDSHEITIYHFLRNKITTYPTDQIEAMFPICSAVSALQKVFCFFNIDFEIFQDIRNIEL